MIVQLIFALAFVGLVIVVYRVIRTAKKERDETVEDRIKKARANLIRMK